MILLLTIIFLVLLLVIGGDRGVVSLLTIAGNLLVFFLMIWAMSARMNPYIITIVSCIAINALTLLYQNGKNMKTAAALIAVSIVMLVLLVLVWIVSIRFHLEGLNEIELMSDLAVYYSFAIHVNMGQVAICLILIGLLGAVMDTAVSIASALYEIHASGSHSDTDLIHSGMIIGNEILSTTLNTLYFVYIGEALLLLIYLQKYNYSITKILNSKAFLQDFTCIIFSMIGCLLVIPVTSYVSAKLFHLEKDMKS